MSYQLLGHKKRKEKKAALVDIGWNQRNGALFEGRTLFLISVKCAAVAGQENDRNAKAGPAASSRSAESLAGMEGRAAFSSRDQSAGRSSQIIVDIFFDQLYKLKFS